MGGLNSFYFGYVDNRKRTLVNFRISDSDRQMLNNKATEHGLDLSEYIRSQLGID